MPPISRTDRCLLYLLLISMLSFSRHKELKESFNYGLFCPPSNGKAGKFLDEERRLGDYPFNGPVGYLEVSFLFCFLLFRRFFAAPRKFN